MLDVGCANARFARPLNERLGDRFRYTGVDENAALLDRRRDNLAGMLLVSIGCTRSTERGIPEEVIRLNTLGTARLGQLKWVEAEAEFRKALAMRPDDPTLITNTAMARSISSTRGKLGAMRMLRSCGSRPPG